MSVREGQPPVTQIPARPATTRATPRLSHAQMSQLVSTIVEMSATAGPALRRSQVRDSITAHLTEGRTPAEILSRARNAYGVIDPTGETAARNVDAGRRSVACVCGCLTPNECVTRRPAPTGNSHCCATFGVDQLAKGVGCPSHGLTRDSRRVTA